MAPPVVTARVSGLMWGCLKILNPHSYLFNLFPPSVIPMGRTPLLPQAALHLTDAGTTRPWPKLVAVGDSW
jgi:hypothetical protein